jgi:hypothetical protein
MSERLTRLFASRWGIVLAGAVIGVLAPLLQYAGNPKNMGICVACFERDIAGALGLHRAAAVQYVRPEIVGLVLGATIAALLFREFKARAGSAPIVRFVLGMFAMIGALTFLGCPWWALFRFSAGDLNAVHPGSQGHSGGRFPDRGVGRDRDLARERPARGRKARLHGAGGRGGRGVQVDADELNRWPTGDGRWAGHSLATPIVHL